MKTYSEFGEDRWVMENVKLLEVGFYADIGCAWPRTNSNSAFLRDRGWPGLCVDGNPSYAGHWASVAPFTCCVVGDGNPAQFEYNGVPELSRIGSGEPENKLVPTVRLYKLLADVPHVDFLTLDLEGHEYEALQTFDWSKNYPLCVISEYSTYADRPAELLAGFSYNEEKHAIEDFRVKTMLEGLGYQLRHTTKANHIFTP